MANVIDYTTQAQILDVLHQQDRPMRAREVAAQLDISVPSITGYLQQMAWDGRVKMTPHKNGSLWEAKAQTAGPRRYIPKRETFTGVDWSVSTMRPGCMDHLKCPSRREDGSTVYHTGKMIHMIGTK